MRIKEKVHMNLEELSEKAIENKYLKYLEFREML